MNGLHLIADLHGCRCAPDFLLNAPRLEAYAVDACRRHGLTVVGKLFHAFRDIDDHQSGVTGTVVLAESHLALHTWPELGAVTLDVYVCNFSGDNSTLAEALFEEMIGTFHPTEVERHRVQRGRISANPTHPI